MQGVSYVLDEFHLQKYLIRLISHMKDSADDAYRELRKAIRRGTKAEFCEIVEKLKGALPKGSEEIGQGVWRRAGIIYWKTGEQHGCVWYAKTE